MQKLASKCQCKYEAVAQTARMPIGAKCLVQQELVQKNSHVHCLSGQQATLWNTCNCPPPPDEAHVQNCLRAGMAPEQVCGCIYYICVHFTGGLGLGPVVFGSEVWRGFPRWDQTSQSATKRCIRTNFWLVVANTAIAAGLRVLVPLLPSISSGNKEAYDCCASLVTFTFATITWCDAASASSMGSEAERLQCKLLEQGMSTGKYVGNPLKNCADTCNPQLQPSLRRLSLSQVGLPPHTQRVRPVHCKANAWQCCATSVLWPPQSQPPRL